MVKKLFLFCVCLSYALAAFSANPRTTLTITDKTLTTTSYTDKEVVLNSQTDLHLTANATKSANVLNNSIVNLNSVNSWLFFDNIRPQFVLDSLLQYINVNGQPAVSKTNARVSIYKQGAVVIPQSASFQPLKVYTNQNFTGDSSSYSMFTFYSALGTMDNKIRSFKLKRGYMATFATSADGTGYSRVYIADDNDLEVAVLPDLLDTKISFIRTFDWEWVTKKGWCGYDPTDIGLVKPTWRYDWSAGGTTTSNVEYVPIRQKSGWPGTSEIQGKTYVSQVLGFNEPDHTEQANLTVSQAVAEWPELLKTGLRIGSPACTNFSWLYSFMDSCKAKNYRVDYVAVHAYWNSKSPQNWYNDLKYIHDKTGRPIWITEWNNGANWTSEYWPDNTRPLLLTTNNAAKQLADLKGILQVLDTANFIERYSIYNWVEDARAMVISGVITPAGQYYADNKSAMAFNKKYEVIPTFVYNQPSAAISFGLKTLSLSIIDPNLENFTGFTLEKKVDDGSYATYFNTDNNSTLKTATDTIDINAAAKIRYRFKSKWLSGAVSGYTNEVGMDVTKGSDIQLGNLAFSNVGWNAVYFKKPYTAIPTIILGAVTNLNPSALLTPRVKLTSYSSKFSIQLSPWAYQKVTSLTKEESVPYLVLNTGTYDLGGLKAIAGRVSATSTWTSFTFPTAFDTIPVVFANQLLAASANATIVRVRNITKTGFDAKIQKETAATTAIGSESITYLAVKPGIGLIDGKKLIVGKTADNYVGTAYKPIYYGDSIANPVFISQMQTCNDDTVTAGLRCVTVSSKYANVVKQREKSTGVVSTLAETVGWMVINPVSVNAGVSNPLANNLKFYPNPVKDYIYLDQAGNETVEIYNTVGVLVKRSILSNNRINVSDLNPGCYIIRTQQNGSNKFFKF